MTLRMGLATLLLAGALSSCGGDSLGPAAGMASARVTDPSGDTYGLDVLRWDLTDLVVSRDTSSVTVRLDFSHSLIAPTSGDSNAMIAFVEFDTDQDSSTGFRSTVDEFRPNLASTGMGAEFQLSLVTYAADSSVPLFNALGVEVARLKPTFSGRRVTIRIPRTALGGDDGYLNAAAIAGTVNSPSDIIPEAGHLHLDAAFTAIQSAAMLREAADSAPSRLLAEGPVASYLPSFIESCQDRPSQAAGTPWTSALDFRPISVLPSRSSASSAAAGCPASSWRTRSDSPAG